MVKRKVLFLFAFSIVFILVACGQADSSIKSVNEVNLDPLHVEIIAPEEVEPQTEHVLQVLVTQGEEKVNDASEVVFEVWEHGKKEESDMIEAELTDEDGVYEITYYFEAENLYYVQPHVTARGTHLMPVAEVKVGNVPDDLEREEHSYDMEGHDNHHHSHDDENDNE